MSVHTESETAMAAALRRAGFDAGHGLYLATAECLRRAEGDQANAGDRLWNWLIDNNELRRQAMALFTGIVAADMTGLPGGGLMHNAQMGSDVVAPARQPNGDGTGSITYAHQGSRGGARPSPTEAGDGGSIGRAREGSLAPAPASATESGAKGSGARAQKGSSTTALLPRPVSRAKRGAADIADAQKPALLSVMDTMQVRGRGPWANIKVGELNAIAVEGTRDAAIAKQMARRVPIGTSTIKSLGELEKEGTITMLDFQRAIQNAAMVVEAEVGNVAA